MPNTLKRGCKHQRQRQAQKKREKHTMFIPIGFMATPSFSSFFSTSKTRYPLPQNFRESPSKRERPLLPRSREALIIFFFLLAPFACPLPLHIFFACIYPSKTSYFTPFCTTSVSRTPPISLELPQLHKHSSIHEVRSWPH